jgi:uncharacterized membrane protein
MNTHSTGLALLAVLLAAGEPPAPSFVPLGDLAGGETHSEVTALSADGSTVVGWSCSAESGDGMQAFAWTAAGGLRALPDLAGGNVHGNAGAATRDGALIVGDSSGEGGPQAVLWNAQHEVIGLGHLEGGGRFSTARGISEDGRFIVGCSDCTRGYQAFVWSREGGLVGLGDAPGGAFNSSAQTVSADGRVIFGTANVNGGASLFRWTEAEGLRTLGDLEGGGVFAEPYAATPDGAVVVGRAMSAASGDRFEAFRWSDDRLAPGLQALGDLPGGDFESWALGVSADGRTIVGFGTSERGQEAVIWTDGAPRRLAECIAEDAGASLQGWTLQWASAISADGRVIAGHGLDPAGHVQGWLWRVPSQPQAVAGPEAVAPEVPAATR